MLGIWIKASIPNLFIYDKQAKKIIHNRPGFTFLSAIKIETSKLLPMNIINGNPSSWIFQSDIDEYLSNPMLEYINNSKEKLTSFFEYENSITDNPCIIQYKTLKSSEK